MTPVLRSASPLAGVMAAQPPSSKRSEAISSSHRARAAIFLNAEQYEGCYPPRPGSQDRRADKRSAIRRRPRIVLTNKGGWRCAYPPYTLDRGAAPLTPLPPHRGVSRCIALYTGAGSMMHWEYMETKVLK